MQVVDIILTFVVAWIGLGMLFAVIWILMENIIMQKRGPDYALWIKKHLDENNEHGWYNYWHLVAIWPFWLIVWAIAAWEGCSLVEWLILRSERRKDTEMKAELKAQIQKDLEEMESIAHQAENGPFPEAEWTEFQEIHILKVQHGKDACISHYVTPSPYPEDSEFIGWRANEDLAAWIPYTCGQTIRDTKKACMKDKIWMILVAPEHKKIRDKMWQGMEQSLKEKEFLDEDDE